MGISVTFFGPISVAVTINPTKAAKSELSGPSRHAYIRANYGRVPRTDTYEYLSPSGKPIDIHAHHGCQRVRAPLVLHSQWAREVEVTQSPEFGELLQQSRFWARLQGPLNVGGSELFGPGQWLPVGQPKKGSPVAPALGICIKVALLVAAWTAAAQEQLLKRFLKWLKLHSTWQRATEQASWQMALGFYWPNVGHLTMPRSLGIWPPPRHAYFGCSEIGTSSVLQDINSMSIFTGFPTIIIVMGAAPIN